MDVSVSEIEEIGVASGLPPPPPPVPQEAGPSEVSYSLKSCAELVAALSDEGPLQPKYEAAQEIRIRTKTDAEERAQFGQGGAIPALVGLLRIAIITDDKNAQETVTCSLLNMAFGNDRNNAAVVEAGSVPLLVELLERLVKSNRVNQSGESQLEGITRTEAEASGASGSEFGAEKVDSVRKASLELQRLENVKTVDISQWLQQALKDVRKEKQKIEHLLEEAFELEHRLMNEVRRALINAKRREPILESPPDAEAAACEAKNARVGDEAVVATLLTLSSLSENKASIVSSRAIPPLVELLRSGSKQGRKDALSTLLNLAYAEDLYDNRFHVLKAGVIPILLYLLHRRLRKMNPSEKAVASSENVLALLYILATTDKGWLLVAKCSYGIPDLVEIAAVGNEKEKQYAASTLWQLSASSVRYSKLVMNESGGFPALVSLSASETSTPEVKQKALNLLKLLRMQCETSKSTQHFAPEDSPAGFPSSSK